VTEPSDLLSQRTRIPHPGPGMTHISEKTIV